MQKLSKYASYPMAYEFEIDMKYFQAVSIPSIKMKEKMMSLKQNIKSEIQTKKIFPCF